MIYRFSPYKYLALPQKRFFDYLTTLSAPPAARGYGCCQCCSWAPAVCRSGVTGRSGEAAIWAENISLISSSPALRVVWHISSRHLCCHLLKGEAKVTPQSPRKGQGTAGALLTAISAGVFGCLLQQWSRCFAACRSPQHPKAPGAARRSARPRLSSSELTPLWLRP